MMFKRKNHFIATIYLRNYTIIFQKKHNELYNYTHQSGNRSKVTLENLDYYYDQFIAEAKAKK